MPSVSKTNIGININKTRENLGQGNPSIKDRKTIFGTIRNIRYPGMASYSTKVKGGKGIQVQIDFDAPFDDWWKKEKDPKQQTRKKNFWFACKVSYDSIIVSQGNVESLLASNARVEFSFPVGSMETGTVERFICDNTHEEVYSMYQNNQSINFVGCFSGITARTKPPGY
jgi:hypothetical protein